MSKHTSYKWISAEISTAGRELQVHDVSGVFLPVTRNQCNIISIFGRARQGKSFLMNCLAGETEIFRISNEKESCTQGIDISNKWLDLKQFSSIDGGTSVNGNIKVGFLDAEGQGDKDVTYDANLVCPILLTSKCVIFNWKGDLQKDHLLETLGIMTRAARNVANDSTSIGNIEESKKFGHLHIVFRDWQAVNTSSQSVYEALFNNETSSESSIRNQIRNDVKASFTSIHIWLFDAPTESTKALKSKLSLDICSTTFKSQLRELRNVLSSQLKTPTIFAGQSLIGQTIGLLVNQIAISLNAGETILPISAYINMMKQELDKVLHAIDIEFHKELDQAIIILEKEKETQTLPSILQANQRIERLLETIIQKYQIIIHNIINDNVCGNNTNTTNLNCQLGLNELPIVIQNMKTKIITTYLTSYKEILSRYLINSYNTAEISLKTSINKLLQERNSIKNDILVVKLNEILENSWKILTNNQLYEGEIVNNFAEKLHSLLDSYRQPVLDYHVELQVKESKYIQELVNEGMMKMNEILIKTFELYKINKKNGFSLEEIEKVLNQEYLHLKQLLESKAQNSTNIHVKNELLQEFDEVFRKECSTLRPIMINTYNNVIQTIFHELIPLKIQKLVEIGLQTYSNYESYSAADEIIEEIEGFVEDFIVDVFNEVENWTSSNELDALLENSLRKQGEILLQQVLQNFQQWIQSNPKKSNEEMEIEEEDEVDKNDNVNVGSKRPASSKPNASAQSQKDKARAFAISQGWIKETSKSKKSTSSVNKKPITSSTSKSLKSVTQRASGKSLADIKLERQKARQWAIDNLGDSVIGGRVWNDENNSSPMNINRRSSSISSSSNNNQSNNLLSPEDKLKIQAARNDAIREEELRVTERFGNNKTTAPTKSGGK